MQIVFWELVWVNCKTMPVSWVLKAVAWGAKDSIDVYNISFRQWLLLHHALPSCFVVLVPSTPHFKSSACLDCLPLSHVNCMLKQEIRSSRSFATNWFTYLIFQNLWQWRYLYIKPLWSHARSGRCSWRQTTCTTCCLLAWTRSCCDRSTWNLWGLGAPGSLAHRGTTNHGAAWQIHLTIQLSGWHWQRLGGGGIWPDCTCRPTAANRDPRATCFRRALGKSTL